jgi:hypothetical protein
MKQVSHKKFRGAKECREAFDQYDVFTNCTFFAPGVQVECRKGAMVKDSIFIGLSVHFRKSEACAIGCIFRNATDSEKQDAAIRELAEV